MTVVEKEVILAISTFVRSGPSHGIAQTTSALALSSPRPANVAVARSAARVVSEVDTPFEDSATEKQQAVAKSPSIADDSAFAFLCNPETHVAVKIVTGLSH